MCPSSIVKLEHLHFLKDYQSHCLQTWTKDSLWQDLSTHTNVTGVQKYATTYSDQLHTRAIRALPFLFHSM